MKRLVLAGVAAVVVSLSALAGPRGGGFGLGITVPAAVGDGPGVFDLDKRVTFVAGQRACVIVTGRQENVPTGELSVLIRDEKGNIVASDEKAYNLVAVWHPNRDMSCTIQILNHDSHVHGVFMSVK